MPADKVRYYNKIDMGIFLFMLEVCLEHESYTNNTVGATSGRPRAFNERPYNITERGGSICKELSRPIYFLPFLWYNLTNR